MAQAKHSQVQAAVVHFRGTDYPVRVAPPGSDYNAIVAASKIARNKGRGDIAAAMLNTENRSQIMIDWGRITLTKKGQAEQEELARLKEIEDNSKLPQPKLIFPTGKITDAEIAARKRDKRKRTTRH